MSECFDLWTLKTIQYKYHFLYHRKLINVLQTHIKNAINNKVPESEMESFGCGGNEILSSEKLLYKTTKNLQYIIKFIIRSRILFAKLNDDKDRHSFDASLEDLLSSFIKLIACPNDLLRSQGAMLKYLHIISSDLMQVYDPIKLRYMINFFSNVHFR